MRTWIQLTLKDFTSEAAQMNIMRLSMVILHMQSENRKICIDYVSHLVKKMLWNMQTLFHCHLGLEANYTIQCAVILYVCALRIVRIPMKS